MLFPTLTTSSLIHLARDLGNGPSNLLLLRSRLLKWLASAKVSWMWPSRLLFFKCRVISSVLKFPRHGGIVLLKLLSDKERYWRELKLQIDGGIYPDNLLFETKKTCVEGGGTRIDPWILLFRRSRLVIFIHGCSSICVRKLLERSRSIKLFHPGESDFEIRPWILLLERSKRYNSSEFLKKPGNSVILQ